MNGNRRVKLFALPDIPEVRDGDDVGSLIIAAMDRLGEPWRRGDILVVAQKIVSKAEGQCQRLADVVPGPRALEIGALCGKDPRKVQLILDESAEIVRVARSGTAGLVIARHRQGWVCANAGLDESNLSSEDCLLRLPRAPDASARKIADTIEAMRDIRPGVIITDTFGRPWRHGLVNVAIGLNGLPAIIDLTGTNDAYGRKLKVSQQAFADEIAAASGMLMVKDAALPAVVVRGLAWNAVPNASAGQYVRSVEEDLFR